MDWTKIPTSLITKRFSDYEIASIVKFQLVWAINEEEPDKKTALRYMTERQYEMALTYIDSISARVGDDVSLVLRKRNAEKIRYNKNKNLEKNLLTDCIQSGSQSASPDKIREDKNKEINKERSDRFDEFWGKYKPVKGKDGTIVSKGSRSDCYKRYLRIINDVDEQTIIDGLERYLTYCSEYHVCSCGAAVFLNQRRWEYEYEVQNKTSRFDKPMSEWTNDDFTAYSIGGGRE